MTPEPSSRKKKGETGVEECSIGSLKGKIFSKRKKKTHTHKKTKKQNNNKKRCSTPSPGDGNKYRHLQLDNVKRLRDFRTPILNGTFISNLSPQISKKFVKEEAEL